MANITQAPVATHAERFARLRTDYAHFDNLLNKQTSENCMFATVQKICYILGAVVVGALETVRNIFSIVANIGILIANKVHSNYFADRDVSAHTPAAPAAPDAAVLAANAPTLAADAAPILAPANAPAPAAAQAAALAANAPAQDAAALAANAPAQDAAAPAAAQDAAAANAPTDISGTNRSPGNLPVYIGSIIAAGALYGTYAFSTVRILATILAVGCAAGRAITSTAEERATAKSLVQDNVFQPAKSLFTSTKNSIYSGGSKIWSYIPSCRRQAT
jgi:hypothetical protein